MTPFHEPSASDQLCNCPPQSISTMRSRAGTMIRFAHASRSGLPSLTVSAHRRVHVPRSPAIWASAESMLARVRSTAARMARHAMTRPLAAAFRPLTSQLEPAPAGSDVMTAPPGRIRGATCNHRNGDCTRLDAIDSAGVPVPRGSWRAPKDRLGRLPGEPNLLDAGPTAVCVHAAPKVWASMCSLSAGILRCVNQSRWSPVLRERRHPGRRSGRNMSGDTRAGHAPPAGAIRVGRRRCGTSTQWVFLLADKQRTLR